MPVSVITGGAGFIGSNLAKRLIKMDHQVYIIDDLSTGFLRNVPAPASFLKADISCSDQMNSLDLPENIDYFFHLAAQSSGEASFDDPLRDIDINYKGTYNVLALADSKHCPRFIYSSSMSVYGEVDAATPSVNESHDCNPVSYYGCNKLASEKIIQLFTRSSSIKPTIFRLFNVFGPGQNMHNIKQGMVSIYLSYLMKNEPVLVKGTLNRFRDFIYVDDVVDAMIKGALSSEAVDEIFNVGTGKKTSVHQLLCAILSAYDRKPFEDWVNLADSTPGDVSGLIADNSKLKARLQWQPEVNIENGLNDMVKWINDTTDWWRE